MTRRADGTGRFLNTSSLDACVFSLMSANPLC